MGKMERYRPFLSIKLPNSMKNTDLARNARRNRDKLISFFDIYKTLKHFLYYHQNHQKSDDDSFGQSFWNVRSLRGLSLFKEIPSNRSCRDALISNRFCNCFKQNLITIEQLQLETGQSLSSIEMVIIDHINSMTAKYQHLCEMYRNIEKFVTINKSFKNNSIVYKLTIIMEKFHSWFDVTLNWESNKSYLTIYGDSVRLDAYGNQADCLNSQLNDNSISKIKNFCYCK
jgi:hypothetical protein